MLLILHHATFDWNVMKFNVQKGNGLEVHEGGVEKG